MKLFFLCLLVQAAYSAALPYDDVRNMVTVPPNCPVGQAWVNGQCRDIWRLNNLDDNIYPRPEFELQGQGYSELGNAVTGQVNCVNGMTWVPELQSCRDIWTPTNVVTVPPNCPDGQEFVNGQCRDIWRRNSILLDKITSNSQDLQRLKRQSNVDDETNYNPESLDVDRRIINVPNQCPAGQRPDALGICRPILE